eukprot:m.19555 g.19555  ORF g.19555 m.19555 type:complete len:389 (-) comp12515_c0_seq1:262-1428(-)
MFGHFPLMVLYLLGGLKSDRNHVEQPDTGIAEDDLVGLNVAAAGAECSSTYTNPTSVDAVVKNDQLQETNAAETNTVERKARNSGPTLLADGSIKDDDCEDKNDNCSWWKEIGECEKNPGYLLQNCPKSCNFCRATLPKEQRCVRDTNEPAWITAPGGYNTMFERIMTDPEIQRLYSPVALSRDPWVVQFDNFVSQQEADNIFTMVNDKFEGSTVCGDLDDNGVIGRQTLRTRTSQNAWCNLDPCLNSIEHKTIQQRITHITGAPDYSMEDMQVLHYHEGQYYYPHHDTINDQIHLMCGPRMLTAFMYFSDGDENTGGATHFTRLGLKVYPKRGHMVLWATQKDEDHTRVDHRTEHEAMNVTHGEKKAGNIWIHEFNYRKASYLGCSG